jgi:16S rRNA processing protein RimM
LSDKRVMLGVVAGAHGVRGEVKLKSFTADPRAIVRYGALEDESGARRFAARVRGVARGLVIARLDGIETRDQAEALKGTKLFVARAALPRPRRGEIYVADLEGMEAVDTAGAPLGRIARVLNWGAGDVLEIARPAAEPLLVPFARRMVPEIDLAAGRVVVDPPVETEARAESGAEDAA